ncbi:MAG: VanZ family protein [Sandaracinaceae bacterium]|nr:VanZ family protein [Sandaracinaceae bacterium]MBK7774165.1 VanZ family protein [Sandaracinaceae bacterium]MBK8409859.1 VanZ family protein [Sandaracinaceae bacterium]MBK8592605.1 VanZ family protein [Sandaracinaceae bacterium]
MTRPTHTLRWLLLGLTVLLPIVAVTLPPSTMAWLRSDYAWIGRPLLWLDSNSTAGLDLTHVVLFAGTTWGLACLWPRAPWWRSALCMLALSIVTEIVQHWVPGRTPRLSDVVDDLLGVGAGLVLALPLRRWARRMSPTTAP